MDLCVGFSGQESLNEHKKNEADKFAVKRSQTVGTVNVSSVHKPKLVLGANSGVRLEQVWS